MRGFDRGAVLSAEVESIFAANASTIELLHRLAHNVAVMAILGQTTDADLFAVGDNALRAALVALTDSVAEETFDVAALSIYVYIVAKTVELGNYLNQRDADTWMRHSSSCSKSVRVHENHLRLPETGNCRVIEIDGHQIVRRERDKTIAAE